MHKDSERDTHPRQWQVYWKHLRVPFQLSLAPLFLWGYFLAAPPDARLPHPLALILGFIAFHFCLYTGITAFNSAYDRDEGPVGGMLKPPPVPKRLLEFSLLIQCLGALLACIVGPTFLTLYLLIALLGVAYSHPRLRWKAHPLASVLTVLIGQGAFGYFAGWAVARGDLISALNLRGVGGLLSAAFTTLGLYPLTQVYQIEEDRARGDRTLAVALGPTRPLLVGFGCLTLAGLAAVTVMTRTATLLDAILVATAYALILWQVARFARAYSRGLPTVASAFRVAMRLNYLTSLGFLIFIALHLAHLL